MKKIVLSGFVIAVLAGCSGLDGQRERINRKFTRAGNDYARIYDISQRQYNKHKKDSLGLEMFSVMVELTENPSEIIALYNDAPEMVRENQYIGSFIKRYEVQAKTSAGADFVDIVGPDALTGDTISISSALALGKPVIVDFWASWCSPCRREIQQNIIKLAAEGEYTILGIAVWEKTVDDTRKAMGDLGVNWPVIFGGDRANSPSELYGVVGIPSLILIGTDGKIISRGHSVEDLFKTE